MKGGRSLWAATYGGWPLALPCERQNVSEMTEVFPALSIKFGPGFKFCCLF